MLTDYQRGELIKAEDKVIKLTLKTRLLETEISLRQIKLKEQQHELDFYLTRVDDIQAEA